MAIPFKRRELGISSLLEGIDACRSDSVNKRHIQHAFRLPKPVGKHVRASFAKAFMAFGATA